MMALVVVDHPPPLPPPPAGGMPQPKRPEVIWRKDVPLQLETPDNVGVPVTVKVLIVVVAKLEVAVLVNSEPLNVKLEEVLIGLVPFPNRISVAVKVSAPVPPYVTVVISV